MSKRAAALFVLLLLVARTVVVLSISDVFFYGEEMAKGAAAKAMLDGLPVPHWKLAYVYHEGGGFIVTHLKALAFALVGENVLAHKLVALLTTSILLLVGLKLVSEHFGSRAAWAFGLLFVFCPGPFQRFSLLSLGTHFEALIPIALVLHFTMRILRVTTGPGDERGRPRDWAGLGFFGGLGLYASLQIGPALAVSALCLLVTLRARVFSRGVLIAAASFVVGAAPLWWMMSHVGLAALRVRGEGMGGGERGWSALSPLLLPLIGQPDVFAWAGVLACAILIPAGLSRVARPIVAYLVLFVAAYLFSGFALPNDGHWFFWLRISSLWFFATVLLAASLARLWDRSGAWRDVALATIAVLLVSGVADLVGLVREGRRWNLYANTHILARTKGYDYVEYADKFVKHLPRGEGSDGGEEAAIGVLLHFRDDPRFLYPAIAHSVFEHAGVPLERAIEISRRAFGAGWKESLPGLGLVVSTEYGHDIDASMGRIESAPVETRDALAEAFGRIALGIKLEESKVDDECRLAIDPRRRDAFLRGAGWRAWRLHRLHPERAVNLIARQSVETFGPLLDGYAAAREAASLK